MSFLSKLVALTLAVSTTAASAAPAVTLPAPDGKFGVGVLRTEFVDAARLMDFTDPASGPRHLPIVIWYPAQETPGGDSAYFAPGVAEPTLQGLERIFKFTSEELKPVADAHIAVRTGPRPRQQANAFPVVIFHHGLLLYPEQNTTLAARLASHGYIVVSVAHPPDSADQRLADGRIITAHFDASHDDPRMVPAFDTLVGGKDLTDRRQALAVYAQSLPDTRIGRSFAEWRADALDVAKAIVEHRMPANAADALASADISRLAFAGMSFGGATAATTCRQVPQCRAVVNLDGQNFDPTLFDAPLQRPLLLVLSDWPRYGLLKGQSRNENFSPNDLAYEPWATAGHNPDVLRVRLSGSRHLGLTDLVALLTGEKRSAHVGDIGSAQALSSVDDLVLAFLNVYLCGAKQGEIEQALQQHPALVRHEPTQMQAWTADQKAAPQT